VRCSDRRELVPITPQLRLEGNSPLKLPGLAVVLGGNFPSSKAAENLILRRILNM
jgi:hypothetical protein